MKRIRSTYLGAVAVALLALVWIAGCGIRGVPPAGSTPPLLEDVGQESLMTVLARPPTVALVQGAQGLRGSAHLGVLRALQEAAIQPDIVVGGSAGAVVGGARASRLSAEQVESGARDLQCHR